jgi:hypothetical protein
VPVVLLGKADSRSSKLRREHLLKCLHIGKVAELFLLAGHDRAEDMHQLIVIGCYEAGTAVKLLFCRNLC